MLIRKLITVAIAVLAVSTLVSGCGQAEDLTAQEVIGKTVGAYSSVQTVKMTSTMSMNMDITEEGKTTEASIDIDIDGSMNVKETEMAMTMSMEMDIPEMDKQSVSYNMYIVDNWMYMRIEAPVVGEQWIKSELDMETWAQQNQLSRQIELLKTAIGVTSAGTETVDGVDCYVLEISPDMAALTSYITSQMGQQAGTKLPDDVDLSKMFKSVTIKEWISRESFLPVKTDMKMTIDIQEDDLDTDTDGSGNMTMDMAMIIKYFDYNKPVTIVLPAGAANAIEQPLTQ